MKEKSEVRVKDIGEVELINRISKMVDSADEQILVSIGDDAAVIKTEENLLQVLTTDILVENVHFKISTHGPFDIGYKSIVVNVSDIAAMAALPRFALISLGLSPDTPLRFVEEFYRGVLEAAREYKVTLIGGDTTRSAELIANVVLIGQVEPDMMKRRSEAKVGDQIVVTEDLGGSAAGLHLMENPKDELRTNYANALKQAHIVPKARVLEARIAARLGANAMEDISDGLASELKHICELSKVGARISADSIPIAPGVGEVAESMNTDAQDLALYGGEDFELVFTMPKDFIEQTKQEMLGETGTKITVIGEIVDLKEGISLTRFGSRTDLTNYGYEHF